MPRKVKVLPEQRRHRRRKIKYRKALKEEASVRFLRKTTALRVYE